MRKRKVVEVLMGEVEMKVARVQNLDPVCLILHVMDDIFLMTRT